MGALVDYSAHSDGELMDRFYAGDNSAVEALFRQNYKSLLASAIRITGESRREAEDIVQETFTKIVKTRKKVSGRYSPKRGASFNTWANTVLRNTIRSMNRPRKKDPALEYCDNPGECVDYIFPEETIWVRETLDRISRMKGEQVRGFVVGRMYGYKDDEIGDKYGASGNAVRQAISKLMRESGRILI